MRFDLMVDGQEYLGLLDVLGDFWTQDKAGPYGIIVQHMIVAYQIDPRR